MDKPPPEPRAAREDPWAVLDPHGTSNDRAVPLRIGVTYRLPSGLDEDDRPSASVTGSRTRVKNEKKKTKKKEREENERSALHSDFRSRPFLADIVLEDALREDEAHPRRATPATDDT